MDDESRQLLLRVLQGQEALAAEVRELRAERIGPRRARETPLAPLVTVLAIFELYAKARGHETSWRLVRNLLRPFIDRLGDVAVMDLSIHAWADHRSVRASTATRTGRPPCDQTLNLEMYRAREMLAWAVRGGLIPSNPLQDLKPVDTVSARETWLNEGQLARLLEHVSALRKPLQRALVRAFILITAGCGMRFNEARRLRRDRIGADGSVVLEARRTKTKHQRIVALTPAARAAIKAIPPVVGKPGIFVNPDTGGLYDETTIRGWFREVAIAAGLDAVAAEGDLKLLPHDMRHTFASQADERGARATLIQDTLGHTTLKTTERYLHRDRRDGALAMAELMSRPPKKLEPEPVVEPDETTREIAAVPAIAKNNC